MAHDGIAAERGAITGWHVLAGVVGFFAIIFAVNGYFLYAALSTHTGVVSVEPYVKGLHYNDRIADQVRQDGLGWRAELDPPVAGRPLRLKVVDTAGNGVERLDIQATLGRPSTERYDKTLAFAAVANGVYEAAAGTLEPGGWVVSIEASRRRQTGEVDTYRMRRRLWLRP